MQASCSSSARIRGASASHRRRRLCLSSPSSIFWKTSHKFRRVLTTSSCRTISFLGPWLCSSAFWIFTSRTSSTSRGNNCASPCWTWRARRTAPVNAYGSWIRTTSHSASAATIACMSEFACLSVWPLHSCHAWAPRRVYRRPCAPYPTWAPARSAPWARSIRCCARIPCGTRRAASQTEGQQWLFSRQSGGNAL